jgi:CxxC-x17-CxxC domain-containing protein
MPRAVGITLVLRLDVWRGAADQFFVRPESVVDRKLIVIAIDHLRGACVECGAPFEHSPQAINDRRGSGLPVSPRCPDCRAARREARNARVLKQLREGDLRARGSQTAGPDEGAERLYSADCAECQRPIRVPFKPRLDRPTYCRSCLEARNGR